MLKTKYHHALRAAEDYARRPTPGHPGQPAHDGLKATQERLGAAPVPLAAQAREATGLNQRDFCARYGFSLFTFRAWEQGRRTPLAHNAAKLSEIIKNV